LLMTIRSDDVSGGYSTYRMAVADEILARTQYERSKDLYEHGAIALNDLQVAQDTEDKAKIAVDTAAEHLRLLGNDPDKPVVMVDIFAPTSGIITDQQATTGSLVQAYNTPYPFTISDLSSTWIVCDVYENDLATVRLGDTAEISLNAYPDRVFKGKVSNIGAILDPNHLCTEPELRKLRAKSSDENQAGFESFADLLGRVSAFGQGENRVPGKHRNERMAHVDEPCRSFFGDGHAKMFRNGIAGGERHER